MRYIQLTLELIKSQKAYAVLIHKIDEVAGELKIFNGEVIPTQE